MSSEAVRRVLVVDDDPGVRHLIWTALRHHGFPVVTASNAADAAQRMGTETFSLLVTDHDMPRETGLELVRRVRERVGPNQHIPVIMISARDDEQSLLEASDAGVWAHVQKPFHADSLMSIVHQAMRGPTCGFVQVSTYN